MNSPFKFLDSYTKEDKDRFFGRTRETTQLFNAVHASNLILLYGASGTGKTSLINCGLANKFFESDWLPLFIRRGSNLNETLDRELRKRLKVYGEIDEDTSVWYLVKTLYLDYYRPVYLIFDQFEELYILGSKEEQKQFHLTVRDMLQAGLKCKIILSIREEYIAYLSEFERMVPSLFDNRLRIEKMNDKNLIRVINGTAKYAGIQIEQPRKLIPIMIDNLRDKREGVDLTNLQVYLDRLWRKDLERQGGSATQVTFDEELVNQVGKLENVLSDFLDEQFTQIEKGLKTRGMEAPQGVPLEVLFTLVTEDGTKRNLYVPDIVSALPRNRNIQEAHVQYCIEEFQRIKLLRRLEDEE